MPLFVIIGHDGPDGPAKRPEVRPRHLDHLRPLSARGQVKLAGPLTDRTGSLIVVDVANLAEAWALVSRDPYVTEGVFASVEVHPFTQVFPE